MLTISFLIAYQEFRSVTFFGKLYVHTTLMIPSGDKNTVDRTLQVQKSQKILEKLGTLLRFMNRDRYDTFV